MMQYLHLLFVIPLVYTLQAEACIYGEIIGNQNDPTCSTYLICDHGGNSVRPCPAGLMWNSLISACDWPDHVNCSSGGGGGGGGGVIPLTSTSVPNSSSIVPPDPDPSPSSIQIITSSSARPIITTNSIPTDTEQPYTTSAPLLKGIKFAPYFDVTLKGPNLTEIYRKTGQKDFILAFLLGSTEGCVPKWGAEINLTDPSIIDPIRAIQAIGGNIILATGGAVGPYFEQLCTSVDSLAEAYNKILNTVKTTYLDIDVESTINADLVNKALAKVQAARPEVTVSYTLMVQAEDYGLNPQLGTDVLRNAKLNRVRVDIVNPMAMEFSGSSSDWGDAVIGAAISVLENMKEIWPEKSDDELKKMLGVTPMIGRNFNGRVFQLSHAEKLVSWANKNNIGRLAFWSVGRDTGNCPNDAVSPYCSSVNQSEYEFIKIFQKFKYHF